jgi:transposase
MLLSSREYTVQQIEHIHQVTNITIYKWLDRFEANGPACLYDEERSLCFAVDAREQREENEEDCREESR